MCFLGWEGVNCRKKVLAEDDIHRIFCLSLCTVRKVSWKKLLWSCHWCKSCQQQRINTSIRSSLCSFGACGVCRRSRSPHSLKRRSAAARLLGLRVRIPPEAWMPLSCECCVLSGTGWSWLRIGTGGGRLWVRWGTFGFQKCGEFLD